MKRFLISLAVSLMCAVSITSCVSTAYAASDGIYGDDAEISVVIANGTPYYYENQFAYWLYNGWYYYRYWNDGYWYYYRYREPIPMYHGWRFRPNVNHRPYYHHRPNVNHHNPGNMRHRPNHNNRSFGTRPGVRSSTRVTTPPRGGVQHRGNTTPNRGQRGFGGRR